MIPRTWGTLIHAKLSGFTAKGSPLLNKKKRKETHKNPVECLGWNL